MLRRGPEHETRQIRYNSGVYTAHYARWYNVLELHEPIRSVRLDDARLAMRYQLLMMGDNIAQLPHVFYE
ncbi:hypothetical protein BRADI_3g58224v3 [Brachypodium distachyon]|uniref:Uncharacterized protein n=1 Tax=Brachypodium distachyon TaxID=15368 RepID=A0A0Q3I7P5_BRADI|nr:hypothetical protein BRADI_3g58224v3 [Brachypodium distachyon]